MSLRGIQWRLFLTCWVIYVLHFATDFAREHYLVLSMVEDHSFKLDKYVGFHPDIFETPTHGAHINGNPGASMVAAIPYLVFRPAVDFVTRRELAKRSPADTVAAYDDPRPWRVIFYEKARRSGLDIRFALVGAITLAFCMAPLSALSAVIMFRVLGALGLTQRVALAGSLLYALGTPIFFRTAFLNQNLMLAVFSFMAFVLLWDPGERSRLGVQSRLALAGFLGGLGVLCDYSGAIPLALLGGYALLRRRDDVPWPQAARDSLWYAAGSFGPILLLWYYQWASFGSPFEPPQAHMAPVHFIDVGYQGVGGPSLELLDMLLFNPNFGLFVAAPVLVLGLFAPFLRRREARLLPTRELVVCLAISAATILFFSTVQYTRLLAITGIRYQVPVIPFLFLPAFAVLLRLPRVIAYALAIGSFVLSWCNAMTRTNEMISIAGSVRQVFLEGFQLPWLTIFGKLAANYLPDLKGTPSAVPFFVLCGVVVWLIWTVREPWRRIPARADRLTSADVR